MSLPIKKIYVDTKYKSAGSASNSNFKIDLPISLSFPENTGFYIDDVCIPHSWYVIEENVNDKLYFVGGMAVMLCLIVKIEILATIAVKTWHWRFKRKYEQQ